MPLLLAFHGQAGAPVRMAHEHAELQDLTDQLGWVTVYPAGMDDGGDSTWSCGVDNSTCIPGTAAVCHTSCVTLGECGRCSWATCYDDVAFVEQLIASLETELCLDKTRYFATGQSNGAMFLHHLLARRPDLFLGAAPAFGLPLLGYLLGDRQGLVRREQGVALPSLLLLHDRNDSNIPWQGGLSKYGWLYEPLRKTTDLWAALHRCSASALRIRTPFDDAGDHLACVEHAGCTSGGRVVECRYDGRHGDWPLPQSGDELLVWFFESLTPRGEGKRSWLHAQS